MSKFLNLVENNLPPQDLDKNREAIQELQRLFASKDIKSTPKTFRDVITIAVGGKLIDLELKHISYEEEAEDKDIKVIAAIAGLPDQGVGSRITSQTARDLQSAKRNMAAAAKQIGLNFLNAAKTSGITTPTP